MRLAYTLEVLHGPQKGTVFALNRKETVLGRGAACDFRLEDTEASRRHCQIIVFQGTIRLKDLGSANGVQVNGRMVDTVDLNNGDLIRIGKTEMRLTAREEGDLSDQTQAFEISRASSLKHRLSDLGWPAKILGVMLLAALISHALVAWPLISGQRKMAADEAVRKAGALVTALAALNQEALRLNDEMLLEVDGISQHEGVVEVYVYDRFGRILAPVARFHQTPSDADSRKALNTDGRMMVERSKGVFDLAEPIRMYNVSTGRFERIGTARIIFSLHTITSLEAGIQRSALISLIVLLLVAAVVARGVGYVTASPIASLRDDLEAVLKGDRAGLKKTYRMAQLDKLAESISRCLAKMSSKPGEAPSARTSGNVTPRADDQAFAKYLVESVLDAVLVVDGQNNVLQANPVFHQMMGIGGAELSGRHFFEAFPDQKLLNGVVRLVQEAVTRSDRAASAEVDTDHALFKVKVAVHGSAKGGEEYDYLVMALLLLDKGE